VKLKSIIRKIPVIGQRVTPQPPRQVFTTSEEYWENRYRLGGNSGPGSYNRLAQFKADFLNRFVQDNRVDSVIEFGSGDGAQLELTSYPHYIGVDVSQTAIDVCRERYGDNPQVTFYHTSELPPTSVADLALSLDVVYHLIEDTTFNKYMHQIFDAGRRFAIIYSSNKDEPGGAKHVRHRKFTDWVGTQRSDFSLIERVPNAYPFDPSDPENTSFADFYVFRRR
jgi:hypothetical protein